jgi:Fe2+ transport system protein FeoA
MLQIIARAPFDGPVSVQIGNQTHPLDRRLAKTIFVES